MRLASCRIALFSGGYLQSGWEVELGCNIERKQLLAFGWEGMMLAHVQQQAALKEQAGVKLFSTF